MRPTSKTMQFLALIALVSIMASCVVVPRRHSTPTRYATKDELYPPNVMPTEIPGYAAGRAKVAEFEAPFDDVWHAVTVGATQALWEIQKSTKNKGVIIATDSKPKQFNSWGYNEVNAVYAIVVREKGPKLSEVLIMKRGQLDCVYYTTEWNEWIGMMIGTLGIGAFIARPPWKNEEEAEKCEPKSVIQWLGVDSDMSQVIVFTRNNLFAAGAL